MVFFEIGKRVKVGKPVSIPSGYKSGVSFMANGDLLVCGLPALQNGSLPQGIGYK